LGDDHARECLALVADTSLSGAKVVSELDAVIFGRGRPDTNVSHNETELTSMALRRCQQTGVEWPVIPRQSHEERPREKVSTAASATSVSTTRCSRRSPRTAASSFRGRSTTTAQTSPCKHAAGRARN